MAVDANDRRVVVQGVAVPDRVAIELSDFVHDDVDCDG
jgi:hypothetical protein